MKHAFLGLAAASLLVAGCGSGQSNGTQDGEFDAQSFFQGQTIRVVITQSVGGGTDSIARLIISKLGDEIPGNPRFAPTNVQDAAGMNRIFNAPADQLVIGVTSNAQSIYTSAAEPNAEHDPMEVQVLGALAPIERYIGLAGSLGYSDLKAASGRAEPTLIYPGSVGGPEEIQDSEMLVPWVCDKLELACSTIQVADDGASTIDLMIERGEANMTAGSVSTAVQTSASELESGDLVLAALFDTPAGGPTVQLPDGVAPPAELSELLGDALQEEYQQMLPIVGTGGLDRVLWAGPSMPEGAVDTIREALGRVLADGAEITGELATLLEAEPVFVPGEEGEGVLHASASTYDSNKQLYADLQALYWEEYWKS